MTGESMIQAARNAVAEAMGEDSSVMVLGEDVSSGGAFGLTKGLSDAFGTNRVRDTPISEASFLGVGVGLALGGARPLVDIMFNDFLTLASDQLFNQAAKLHFMSGGKRSVPLTVWTVGGAGTRWGAQHSQRLDGWLTQIPGLKVLAPSSPRMMFSSMKAALSDPDPVVVVADRSLLYSQNEPSNDSASPWSPRIVLPGGELTVVASGRLTHLALGAASDWPGQVEVIDLQRVGPLDVGLICDSLTKTGKLLIVHDEVAFGGLAASLALAVSDRAFWSLDAPIRHLSSPATPVPAAANLEDAYLVDSAQIAATIREMLEK